MDVVQEDRRMGGSVARLPGWLVFLVFVPLQIWIYYRLFQIWHWWTVPFFILLGILGNRAARAAWLTQLIFPRHAYRHELRRHIFQGILFLAAAITWLLPKQPDLIPVAATWPQPWLPLAFLVTLLKATLR